MNGIVSSIKNIYCKGNFAYALKKFIDKYYYFNKLKKILPDTHIENLTDFNYGKCFSMFIYLSNTKVKFTSDEFKKFIKKEKNLYIIDLEISILAPYCFRKYLVYRMKNNKIVLDTSNIPIIKDKHEKYEEEMTKFISNENLKELDDRILTMEVPGIELELRDGKASVYNCLFEDTASYFPYKNRMNY